MSDRLDTEQPLWRPNPEQIAASNLTRFTQQVQAAIGRELPTYADLHRWSIDAPDVFWSEVWRFTDVLASERAVHPVPNLDRFPGARWFEGAKLNYAENLLRFRDDKPALISYLEDGTRNEISYAELYRQATALAASLKDLGVGQGDRIAGWLPNTIEAAVAMLATATIGAVWSSCSPDFGADGALDRFGQIEPKVLICCDGYRYNGKAIDIRAKVGDVAAKVPSILTIVWVSILNLEVDGARFSDLLCGEPAEFEQLDFNHPLAILYSSGTTGKPKCIVHGAGGTLLQHLKEHQLHTDLSREDTLFFFTTCGWMMWNWLVSALATGCRIVLYDGSPFHPSPAALWDMSERERVSVFGISAKYLSSLEKIGFEPHAEHRLDALRMLISTGSTLTHEGFRFVYRSIKTDVHLVSMTGGTDIISCFILGNPNLPVYAGELQSKGLGMAVEVWDDAGHAIAGEKGELVCSMPFPSAPIGFWNDADEAKYRAAYFEKYPGVWAHGDFAEITQHDGFIIHGRSDAVLNPGGVRIGTAEIYRQVEQVDAVLESVCVGQDWEGDTRVVLFVVLRPELALSADLVDEIKQQVRTHASPRHVPQKVIAVPDIPRTMSGKIAELAVRDTIHGRTVENTAALANPEALSAFIDLAELET